MAVMPTDQKFASPTAVEGSLFETTTVMVRFRFDWVTGGASGANVIVGTNSGNNSSNDEGWSLHYNEAASNFICLTAQAASGSWGTEVTGTFTGITKGNWYCLGYVRDPDGNNEAHLYLRDITDPYNPGASQLTTDSGVTARYSKTGVNYLSVGTALDSVYGITCAMVIDDVRVFDVAMTQSQMDGYSMCGLSTVSEPNLGCWVDFTTYISSSVTGYNRDGSDTVLAYSSGSPTTGLYGALCDATKFTAHQYWDERIQSAFASRRNMYRDRAIGGRSDTGVAVIQLVNTDGEFDDYISRYSLSGRDAVLWMGTDEPGVTFANLLADPTKRRNYLAEITAMDLSTDSTTTLRFSSQGYAPIVTEAPVGYGVVFRGVVAENPLPGMSVATLNLKDKQHLLDETPSRPVYSGGEDGIKFSGSNGRATIASSAELDLTGDMTVMVRVKPDALATQSLIGWRGGTRAPWKLDLMVGGSLRLTYSHSGGTVASHTSAVAYEAAKWQMVGFRISGDQLTFFTTNLESSIDRADWSSSAITMDASTRDAAVGSQFYLGATSSSSNGYVDEVRVWDGSGGASYVRVIEQRFLPNDIPGGDTFTGAAGTLVGYWKCNEGSGTSLTDSSASANTLALTGGYAWDFPLAGSADLAGKEMPLAFGKFLHVEPTLVDAGQLIFQVHSRSIDSITELLENGGDIHPDLTYNGGTNDEPDLQTFIDAVAGSDFVVGEYITHLAGGMLKLGASPSGAIRASGTGDDEGGYVSTAADIIERMVVDFGPLTAADIDSTSFSNFNTAAGSAVNGITLKAGDQTKLSALVDRLLVGARGWWIFDRSDGEMELGQFDDPKEDAGASTKIYDYHIAKDGITPVRVAPPSRRQKIGYARTWGPLQREGLIGTAADARIDELAEPYRWITVGEDSIAVRHLSSEEPPEIGTTLADRDDAFEEAVARQHLYGVEGRRMFVVKLSTAPDTFELGDLVQPFHPTRYGWSAGELYRVVGVDEGSMTIKIWG